MDSPEKPTEVTVSNFQNGADKGNSFFPDFIKVSVPIKAVQDMLSLYGQVQDEKEKTKNKVPKIEDKDKGKKGDVLVANFDVVTFTKATKNKKGNNAEVIDSKATTSSLRIICNSDSLTISVGGIVPQPDEEQDRTKLGYDCCVNYRANVRNAKSFYTLKLPAGQLEEDVDSQEGKSVKKGDNSNKSLKRDIKRDHSYVEMFSDENKLDPSIHVIHTRSKMLPPVTEKSNPDESSKTRIQTRSKSKDNTPVKQKTILKSIERKTSTPKSGATGEEKPLKKSSKAQGHAERKMGKEKVRKRLRKTSLGHNRSSSNKNRDEKKGEDPGNDSQEKVRFISALQMKMKDRSPDSEIIHSDGDEGNVADESDEDYVPDSDGEESGDEDSKKKRTAGLPEKTKVTTTEKKYPGSIIRSNLVSILPPSLSQKKITISAGNSKNDQKSEKKHSYVPNPVKSKASKEGKDSSTQQQTISVKSSKSTLDPKTPVSLSLKEEGKVKMEGVLNINNLGPLQSIIQKELLNNLKIQGITHMMLAKSTNGSSILIPLQTSPTPTKGSSPTSSGDSSGKQVRVILVKQGTQQKSTDLGKKTMFGKEKESIQSAKTLSCQGSDTIASEDPEGDKPEGTNEEVTEMDSTSKLDGVNKEGEKSNENGNDNNELEQMELGEEVDSENGLKSKADEKNGQNLENDDKDVKKKTSLITGGLPLVTCEGIIPITSLLSGKVVSSTLLTEFQKNGVTHMMLARNAENTPLLVPLQNNSRGQPIFPTGAVAAIVRNQSAQQSGSLSPSAKSKTLTLQTSTKEGDAHKSDGKIMVNIEQISMPLSVKTSKFVPNVTIQSSAAFPPKQILPGPGPDTTTIFVDTSGTEIKRTTHDFHERIQQQIKEDEEEAQGKKPPKLTALGGQMESYSTRRKTSGKRFPFQHNCRFCHSQFRVLIDLIAHLEERHWDRPDLQEELEAVRLESQKMKCDICGRVLSNSKMLQIHKKSNHETERKMELCHLCPSSFNRRHELRNHIRVVHEKIKTLECSLCKTKFATKAKMLTHEQNVHRVGRVDLNKCENCSKVFPSRDHLSHHLQKEHGIIRSLKSSQWHWHGQQKYNCLNCGKEFEHEMVFQAHRKRCQVVHMCAYCGIAIRKMSSIVDHVTRIHYEEKKLFCTVCEPERKFDSKKTKLCHDILYHNASFTQEDLLRDDEFGCRHCPRHFETRMKLFCHVRDDHQKDCCFQCTECNAAFFFEKGLDNHMRCIEHEKPHDEIFKILDKPPESKTYGRLNVDGSESMPDGSKSKKGGDNENQDEVSEYEGGSEIMKENEILKENDEADCSEVAEKPTAEVQSSDLSTEQSATESEIQASRSSEQSLSESQTNEIQPDQSFSDTSQSVDSTQKLAADARAGENNAKEQLGKKKSKEKLGKRKDRLSINVSFTSPDEQGNLLVSYFCAFCGDCFDEENNFTKHVRKHLNFEPFKCPDCEEEFDRKAEFSFHFSKEHPEKSLPEEVSTKEDLHCIFCEKDLSMKNMMIHLLADHSDQFTYVCENVCKRRFQTLEARENHTEKCIELDERGLEQVSSSIRAKRKRKAKVLSKLDDELFYEAPEVDTIGDFGSGKKVQVGYRSHNAAKVVTKNLYVCGGKMYQLVEVEGKRLLMEISETDIRKTSSSPDVQVCKEKKAQTKDASGQTEKEQMKKSTKGKTVVFCGFCKQYIEHKAVLQHGCLKHLKKETLIKSLSDIGLTEADLELGQEEIMERMAATRDASTSMDPVENQPNATKSVDNNSSIQRKPNLDSEGSVGVATVTHMSPQSKVMEKTKKLVTVDSLENMVSKKPSEEVSMNDKPQEILQEISQRSSIQSTHMPGPATGTSVSANAVSQNVSSRVEITSATPHQNPRVVVLKTPSSSMQSFYGTSLINAELHTATGKKTPVKLFRVAQSPKMTSTPIQKLHVQSGASSFMHRGYISSTGTSIQYTTVEPPVGSYIQDSSQVELKEMKITEIFSEELQSDGQHRETLAAESAVQEMEIEEVQYASNILSVALGEAQTVGQEFF
ncbi:hypothetical protein ACJMK2_014042 [Sinanodonta woodiana]|uniref:C2H2-type domain-containing protein n=1 Tax=Sinanodonta woodiana TaxID=1069815 RepID=A0ABD3V2B2_SINWO